MYLAYCFRGRTRGKNYNEQTYMDFSFKWKLIHLEHLRHISKKFIFFSTVHAGSIFKKMISCLHNYRNVKSAKLALLFEI